MLFRNYDGNRSSNFHHVHPLISFKNSLGRLLLVIIFVNHQIFQYVRKEGQCVGQTFKECEYIPKVARRERYIELEAKMKRDLRISG